MVDAQLSALVMKSWKYKAWLRRIQASGCQVLDIEVKYVVQRKENTFYTALIDGVLVTPEGDRIHRCVLLVGPSVVIVPVFICEGMLKTIIVRQRRIVDGELSLEFPAGGIQDGFSVKQAAVQEVHEELGLKISETELISLTTEPLMVCPSMVDETAHWFAFVRRVQPKDLINFENRKAGVQEDQEHTELQVLDLLEVVRKSNVLQVHVAMDLLRLNATQLGIREYLSQSRP